METYIIAFDIVVENFPKVKNLLQKFPENSPIHGSCWVVKSDKTPVEIRREFSQVLDYDDGVLIIRSGTYSAWRNHYGEETNEEIKQLL